MIQKAIDEGRLKFEEKPMRASYVEPVQILMVVRGFD